MAGGQERILRRRIKSVQATRKITKAMELIAASQISRSQARIIANRPYRNGMQRIIIEAALGDPAAAKKLLVTPEKIDTAIVLVITGDRGLSGAYNSSVLRAGERLVRQVAERRHQRATLRGRARRPRASSVSAASKSNRASWASSDRPRFADARRSRAPSPPPSSTAKPSRCCSCRRASSRRAARASRSSNCCPSRCPRSPCRRDARRP